MAANQLDQAGTDPVGQEGHDLRAAGPCMNNAQPMLSAATALSRTPMHEPKQATGCQSLSVFV